MAYTIDITKHLHRHVYVVQRITPDFKDIAVYLEEEQAEKHVQRTRGYAVSFYQYNYLPVRALDENMQQVAARKFEHRDRMRAKKTKEAV